MSTANAPAPTDADLLQHLSLAEQLQWYQADEQIKQAESDIKSGEWYLARQVSSINPSGDVREAHAVGRRMVERGKEQLAKATATRESMRQLALARAPRNEDVPRGPAQFTVSLPIQSEKFNFGDIARKSLQAAWNAGFTRIHFAGIFAIEDSIRTRQVHFTDELRANLEQIDSSRFTLQPAADYRIEGATLLRNGVRLEGSNAVILGIETPEPVAGMSLLAIHVINANTGESIFHHLIVHAEEDALTPGETTLHINFTDTNRFLERIQNLPTRYNFRYQPDLSPQPAVPFSDWMPELARTVISNAMKTPLGISDALIRTLGGDDSQPALSGEQQNATWKLGPVELSGAKTRAVLHAIADQSGISLEVGAISVVVAN